MVGDGTGRIFVQDATANGTTGDQVLEVSTAGVMRLVAAPAGAAFCGSSQIARSAGDLFIWNTTTSSILRITETGTTSPFSTVNSVGGSGNCDAFGGDNGVNGLLTRPAGGFFGTSPLRDRVFSLSADGLTVTDLATVAEPQRLAFSPSGRLVVDTNVMAGRFYAIEDDGGITGLFGADAGLPVIYGYRFGADGSIYATAGSSVIRITQGSGAVQELASCFPGGITDVALEPLADGGTGLFALGTDGDSTGGTVGDQIWVLTP